MSVTVNTFPPLQSMNSPRVWALAIIALLHLAFFWVLTSGLGTRIVAVLKTPPIKMVPIAPSTPVEPVKRHTDFEVERLVEPIFVPRPETVVVETEPMDSKSNMQTTDAIPQPHQDGSSLPQAPVVEEPVIDPRMPLSEPIYPAAEVRLGHSGTVLLEVYVLENGRIGEARITQSSGFSRLDVAAEREARRWRLKPGTQDGRPIAMWKTIPITFQLKK